MKSFYCYQVNDTREDTAEEDMLGLKVTCFGYKDFAGSGVVHAFAATCALAGCYIIGPRKGRFGKGKESMEMLGHSVPLAALGGFLLLFGFLAFNGGSQVIE